MEHQEIFAKLVGALETATTSLKEAQSHAKKLGKKLGYSTDEIKTLAAQISVTEIEGDEKIVEGIFDGQNMIGPKSKLYPVPANYASKSKLVEGDHLKLTITDTGAFLYKQIEPTPRKMAVGHLVVDGSQYQVLSEGRSYNVLYASVTFYRANVGDQVTILIPENIEANWAAIENVLPESENAEENFELLAGQ